MRVFLKDHPQTSCVRDVLADRRFLAQARHAFLIRRPERACPHTAADSAELARFAAHHQPFYEQLYAQ
ncbi:MAG TPA: hypothetical protein VFW50_06530, partial [Streptosporangiaceae bacterium]|nr:hypothetical protein [Streptosporangiaceae bacterium]